MPRYAADTSVSTDRSRQEIESVLRRSGPGAREIAVIHHRNLPSSLIIDSFRDFSHKYAVKPRTSRR